MTSVGSIIGGGLRVVRDHPAAVAVWGALYLAAAIALYFAVVPSLTASAAMTDPVAMQAHMASMMGSIFLINFAYLFLIMVLLAAAYRVVLRSEESGLAFLRLGMDELRLFGLTLLVFIAAFVVMLAVGLIVGLVAGLVIGAVAVASGGAGKGVFASGILLWLAFMALAIFVEVRLSLIFPLTFLRRRITIGESWRLTRGRFWTLFGAYFVLALIFIVLSLAISAITMGPYLSILMHEGFTSEGMMRASQMQLARQAHGPDALMMISWVIYAALGAIGVAMFGGAAATATRELLIERGADPDDDDGAVRESAQVV